ncbi:MAG: adenosylhomocysteinase [Thermoplasmata archaeon]|nr:adenosylhomocysteinase [Thermoplasmata archaeon]NIS11731.1 adenosylhomocysteinase [Thermoplasmata archaeon]NIS19627.1 adenosylhomocysteinase [Thermoplasmata archaeon]NIT76795.1 adenosylhomocysteinase [Thermoplasmata archaeon]NIU48740.1 adenosylhomocysteinase [Thermoplasmata archaeon]
MPKALEPPKEDPRVRTIDEEGSSGGLLDRGIKRLAWARDHMPVLAGVRKRLKDEGVLEGVRVGMALHVEAKTGMLALTLVEAGAQVRLASCNPLSTDDSVSIALREHHGLATFACRGESDEEYYSHLDSVLDLVPQVVVDDGGDLVTLLHTRRTDLLEHVWGGCEETTTGVVRLRAMERDGALRYPVIAVNDAMTKHLFDNRYGTGQSTLDGIMRATNLLLAGRTMVVAGYGWCGRGVAMRARGMGARVIVTEVDPVRATEALLDGMDVAPMAEAILDADFLVTVTGCASVVRPEHFQAAKDGLVVANAGHFDVELDLEGLGGISTEVVNVREDVTRYVLEGGKRVDVLADGRLVNLAAGQGHPVEIMDMSFALQALSIAHIVRNRGKLEPGVHPVPKELDQDVAWAALASSGVSIDCLTDAQCEYMDSWKEGT